jgi:diguanylate cyclase (GGDEF)-like protein
MPADRAEDPGSAVTARLADWLSMFSAVQACLSAASGRATHTLPLQLGRPVDANDPAEMRAVMRTCAEALSRLRIDLIDAMQVETGDSGAMDLRGQVSLLRASLQLARQAERLALHQASHDALTELPNRACFTALLQAELIGPSHLRRPLAVLFIDLDQLKPVNDAHGHGAGDELLRIVALRLKRTMRAQDLVSRFGGDEFACLLLGLDDVRQITRIASDMRDVVAAPLRVAGDVQLRARASVGVARAPLDGDCPATLIRHADAAMYRAKRDGSGLAFRA